MKTVAFYTLGCKVNQYDTEAMAELFEKRGYKVVDSHEFADIYVINTCTVTNLSDRKSRQFIRRAKKKNPKAKIVVAGCYAQTASEEVLKIEGVNLIIGTNKRNEIVELIEAIDIDEKANHVDNIMKIDEFEELSIEKIKGKTRAFLKIQEGCNQFCSYCIIPYARGPVRSRKFENIISEVKRLSKNGFKEIVLTGIHIASYGKDLKDKNLIDVIKAVHGVEGIERIRLSSVEPNLITEKFIEEIKLLPKFCNHLHLSLQSGCDETLKRMNRKYTTEEYRNIVLNLRKAIPDIAITTDIIVGFPGETDEEFNTTCKFVKEINFSQIHVFKYSPRKGTPAAKFKNQVHPNIKNLRSEKMIKIADDLMLKYRKRFIDKTLDVLFEDRLNNDKNIITGLTTNYINVAVEGNEDFVGKIIPVKLKKIKKDVIIGEIINK
ncbi:threonylcarbamoyladenosine tRNA methylthiotransferase MtaB [Caminicella sporogenes DSM 14501]|uniref:Threonylcarbamoyladenosine tRNA methylthiotransferase MtaB n=1 Tax=Caminicella sporogenes DSM 14501 TaxID=1121266 RepID=A0A1M6MBY8_9FIRM|nr:tRNA (N(6)-L-threonylcarbamoyladenosine(37)-C(2))-methylthiotransferase MtaB [Caminicella sporogenes]RKD27609.1 tRNA (N(6)-L-threonylcarbamoyladenosine(37)-C(2))-methylthiotransferase MtaB [Caminicella sporogenes]SHJ81038.1 threonylcarbamoyladenosine tRNA methylthiotransferase MtaB [Caminicella sporogenes DSM 14501]